jgi:hypothetical protein
MNTAAAIGTTGGRGASTVTGRLGELAEPRSHRGKRAHEAARPQQMTAHARASAQIAVEPFLLDFIHVQQTILRPPVERGVLDIFADDPGASLVAAAKQPAALVEVRRRLALGLMIMLSRHVSSV